MTSALQTLVGWAQREARTFNELRLLCVIVESGAAHTEGPWLGFDDLESALLVWAADVDKVRRLRPPRTKESDWESVMVGLKARRVVRRHGVLPLIGVSCFETTGVANAATAAMHTRRSAVEAGASASRMAADASIVSDGDAAAAAAGATYVNDVTFNRSNVSTIKRSERNGAAAAAATSVAATAPSARGDSEVVWRERVRKFVGDRDYFEYWAKGQWGFVFQEELPALQRALNYLEAGVSAGEVRIRKTKGAALWDQFQNERSAGFVNRQGIIAVNNER